MPLEQLVSSNSVHAFLQSPPSQDPPHETPHLPQLFVSVVTSTQVSLQFVSVPQVHAPWLQVAFVMHVCPHAPQFAVLEDVSTHTPEQPVNPSGHDVTHSGFVGSALQKRPLGHVPSAAHGKGARLVKPL